MRVVIAGGPYSGKTTLVNALKEHGFSTINEAAFIVISEEQANGNMEPWANRQNFQDKILNLQIEQFKIADSQSAVFDRGIPDGLAYYYLDGIEPTEEGKIAASSYRYDIIFIPELLEEYDPGITRGESLEKRQRIHSLIKESYEQHGYSPIIIPKGSVQERVEFVKEVLQKLNR